MLKKLEVTRLEVIDETGRVFVDYNTKGVTISIQDDGKTMKIFTEIINGKSENN